MANTVKTSLTIQAAEEGKQINFTQGANPVNFTSATVAMLVTPTDARGVATGSRQSYTCAVTGSTPHYSTTGSEFPTAGIYAVQLEYDNSGPEKYYSPVAYFNVAANL